LSDSGHRENYLRSKRCSKKSA